MSRLINEQKITLLIFSLSILIFIILHIYYNKNIKKTSRLDNIKNKIKNNEKFINITLNHLNNLNNNQTIDISKLNSKQQNIINDYYSFFNKATRDELQTWSDNNKNNALLTDNLNIMISNYNKFNKNVENVLQEINYDLLKQLHKNYAKAHKINIKRQVDLDNIDFLPQRFD